MENNELVDLVLCVHPTGNRKFLFKAPGRSGLVEGSQVLVDTQYGEQPATVVDIITINPNVDTDILSFIINISNATLPLRRVISKFELVDFTYND